MKYILLIYMNPVEWNALSAEDQNAVFLGHEEFQRTISETGEFIRTEAIADPSESSVVRVRSGSVQVIPGAYQRGAEFVCGHYLVECESKERALEVASLVPEARLTAIEVRPVVHQSGPGM